MRRHVRKLREIPDLRRFIIGGYSIGGGIHGGIPGGTWAMETPPA